MRADGPWGSDRVVRGVIAAATAVLAAYFVYFPLVNSDIWWHLAAGREMAARGRPLFTDPFAYTLDHPRWVDVHWLFQAAVYAVMRPAGPWGLVIVKCLVAGCACGLLCLVGRSVTESAVTGPAVTLFVYEARHLVLMRPIVVTLLCLALFLMVLERFRMGGRRRVLAALLPVQLLWVNTQGLFVLGPVLVGCYLAGAVVERVLGRSAPGRAGREGIVTLAICLAALVGVSFVNPYGAGAVALPLKLLGRINPSEANIFSRNITENLPLPALRGSDIRYVYAVSAVTALSIVLGYLGGVRLAAAHVFVWLGFLALAYMAKRNVLLYLFVSAPLVGTYGAGVVRRALAARGRAARVAVYGALAVSLSALVVDAVNQAGMIAVYPRGSAVAPFRYPVQAVDYLRSRPVEGRLFNADRYGGYLLWELYPKHQVFMDGRTVIRTPAFFAEYLAILERPEVYFDGVAEKFAIGAAVLPTAYHPVYMPLVEWLYGSPRWRLGFTDGASVVYVREDLYGGDGLDLGDSACVDSIRREQEERWREDEQIRAEAVIHIKRLSRRLSGRPAPEGRRMSCGARSRGREREVVRCAEKGGRFGPGLRKMLYYDTGLSRDRLPSGIVGPGSSCLCRCRNGLVNRLCVQLTEEAIHPPRAFWIRHRGLFGLVGIECQPIPQEALCSCVPS